MPGPVTYHIARPRDCGLARFVLRRLSRENWLDVPWVHASGELALQDAIPEDASDFPAATMLEAGVVSSALRQALAPFWRDFEVTQYSFWPTTGAETLDAILQSRGHVRATVDPSLDTDAKSAIAQEPTAIEATRRLLSLWWPTPASFLQPLFCELIESQFEQALALLEANQSHLASCFSEQTNVPRARVVEALATIGPRLSQAARATLLGGLSSAKDPVALVQTLVNSAHPLGGSPPALTATVAREVFPYSRLETKLKLLQRDGRLLDLGVRDAHSEVRAAAARSASAASDLAILLADPAEKVRVALAKNGRLSSHQLEALSRTAFSPGARAEVELDLARNPKTPTEVLAHLVKSERVDVRCAAAGHQQLSESSMEELSRDGVDVVRQRVVRRGDLPDHLRERLLQDPLDIIRFLALAGASNSTDAELSQLDGILRVELREAVSKHTKDPHKLVRFAADSAHSVRQLVGANAATPLTTLEQLSRDANGYVRGAVASNVAAGAEVLGRLSVDPTPQVRTAAAASLGKLRAVAPAATTVESEQVPPELEEVLLDPIAASRRELARQRNLPRAVLEALAEDADLKVRLQLVRAVSTPPDLLELLCTDADTEVRAAVAACPRASVAALSQLVEDENLHVRALALEQMAKKAGPKKTSSKQKRTP